MTGNSRSRSRRTQGPTGLVLALLLAATAASRDAAAQCDDISALDDEFDSAATLADWQNETVVSTWPVQVEVLDINQSSPGHLYIEPAVSGWFQDYRGVLLYKEVTGNFTVTTRVMATGLATDVPTRSFSLAGLMVRRSRHEAVPEDWTTMQEDWVFISAGTGDSPGTPQIETKDTDDSFSVLELTEGRIGWVELRIDRIGPFIDMYRRFEGEDWVGIRSLYRDDLPPTVQVGLECYSDWQNVEGHPGSYFEFNSEFVASPPGQRDLIARFDYIRFARPTDGVMLSPADFNRNGYVDLADFEFFAACETGPGGTTGGSCCDAVDLDADGDADLLDFAQFGQCFGGLEQAADPNCGT